MIRSIANSSHMLNRLRLAAGGIVTYSELGEAVWPERRPRLWRVRLYDYLFDLREAGFPIVTEYGRGLRFQPNRKAGE